ncbi:DNA endonuclease RBBP8 isoform 2-T2 [Menidia menidia]
MSSPGDSSGTPKNADPFEDLWRQLGECHQHALKELEAKVSKLKKDRCLDAQRLEVFYSRNQQLKEQNKTLQGAISLLEERLRAGGCDRCAVLEEHLKNDQDKNLQLIGKLKEERNSLDGENKKLQAELKTLKASHLEPKEAPSPEQEDGIIPDSPLLASSLPVGNKLRKRKRAENVKRVRYAETPLPQSNSSLLFELNKDPPVTTKNSRKVEVLVPNTCVMEASQISEDNEDDMDEAVAETCGFELRVDHDVVGALSSPKKTGTLNRQGSSRSPWKNGVRLKPYGTSSSSTLKNRPDSTTERSPSLLPRVRHSAEEGSICRAKGKKGDSNPGWTNTQKDGKHIQPEGRTKQSIRTEPIGSKVQAEQMGATNQNPDVPSLSPAFKKPQDKLKGGADGRRRTAVQFQNASQSQQKQVERKHSVEQMWSIDPALALSMYDSEPREDETETQQRCGDLTDTDCTWVSHSMLQRRGEDSQDREGTKSGLGVKAHDSLDVMFDTTAYEEYKSFNNSRVESQTFDAENDDDEEEGENEDDSDQDPHEHSARPSKDGRPAFAHVAVVRKKDERRKLKGTTCKECEVYYAHLPEGEKQKKLSACSRHRFLYIPPCTPENFWEVGFPSTQTCIDRGYIREEKNPQARLRRRQPLNALFSPKQKQPRS